jgi:predicted aspartyl protease
VIAKIKVANRIGQVVAERGFLPELEIRLLALEDILVDTGATSLCLPTALIERLGLVQGDTKSVETAAGIQQGQMFRDVDLQIAGLRGTLDCLELTHVNHALLGVVPMEMLGLEPDLTNRKLRVLPVTPEQTDLSVV